MDRSTSPSDASDEDIEMMFDEGSLQILGCNEDDIALKIAAERSRVPFDRPTEHELAFFPELWDSKSGVQVFLSIRNTALKLWLANPLEELGLGDLKRDLPPPLNSDVRLVENIHQYLTRNGLINVGRFRRTTRIPKLLKEEERKVVVIGAGVAGISAALQLISFGFDVTILEGRTRIGGRVSTISDKKHVLEIGADTIRNSRSNPMTVLIQQLNVEPYAVNERAPIFDNGKPVETNRDQLIYMMYIGARDALEYLCHSKEQRDENGLFVSRQRGFENLLNIIERDTLVNYYKYWDVNNELVKKREHSYQQMKICREIALLSEKRLSEIDESDAMMRRSLRRDINSALDKFEIESAEFEKCETYLSNYRKYPASKQYMHPFDYKSFNFYLAHEEFVFGAPLEKVQLSCEAVKNRMPGASLRIKEGLSSLLEKLIEERDIDLRFDHKVIDIDSTGSQVVLKVLKNDGKEEEIINANYCVSTLPLGILKKTIKKEKNSPKFKPELPQKKIEAIRCMGYGLTNKVVMLFDRAFWETSERYYFSNIAPSLKGRGEMLFWQTIPGTKVLTTFLVGNSAQIDLPDDVIVSKAMSILMNIFPQTCPRMPIKAFITRYHEDEFAAGSNSYMSLRTEMHHYEDLIEPLKSETTEKNLIYFAGEHTSALYSGSLQGAWLSGIRAAADIANDVYGINFANFGDDVEMAEEGDKIKDEVLDDKGITNGSS